MSTEGPAVVGVLLPGGYWHDGACHRRAEVRPLSGADEAALAEAAHDLTPAEFATAVLTRGLVALGPVAPVDGAAVRRLLVGDGEALLLHVQRLTYGPHLDCLARCPVEGCGTRIECEMAAEDLLLAPGNATAPWHEARIGRSRRLRFRLPTVGDREQAAALARRDPEAACAALVQALLAPGQQVDPGRIRQALGARLAALDPQAEIRLRFTCPGCARPLSVLFDVCRYLLDTIRWRARDLFNDVHRLARAYHWSERDILGLSQARRRLYLDLLTGEGAA